MAFPYRVQSSKIIADIPQELSTEQSQNQAFPDLYLFVDRTISPLLFAELWKQLPNIFSSGTQNFSGLEKLPSDWATQIVLFRPVSSISFQALLIGNFPHNLIQSSLRNQPGWLARPLDLITNKRLSIFDNSEINLHLALIGETAIALQSDISKSNSLFDQHISRSVNFLLNDNSVLSNVENSFKTILTTEGTQDNLFALLSVALPPSVPASAMRLRIQPVKTEDTKLLDLQVDVLPRPGNSLKSLKTSIKLALLGFSGMAGLDASFINGIIFAEKDNLLAISGLHLTEKSTANLLGALIKQAANISNPENEKDAQ